MFWFVFVCSCVVSSCFVGVLCVFCGEFLCDFCGVLSCFVGEFLGEFFGVDCLCLPSAPAVSHPWSSFASEGEPRSKISPAVTVVFVSAMSSSSSMSFVGGGVTNSSIVSVRLSSVFGKMFIVVSSPVTSVKFRDWSPSVSFVLTFEIFASLLLSSSPPLAARLRSFDGVGGGSTDVVVVVFVSLFAFEMSGGTASLCKKLSSLTISMMSEVGVDPRSHWWHPRVTTTTPRRRYVQSVEEGVSTSSRMPMM